GSFSTDGGSRPPSGRAFIGAVPLDRRLTGTRTEDAGPRGATAVAKALGIGRASVYRVLREGSIRTSEPKQSSRESVARCSFCRWVPCPRHPAACSARRTKHRLTCKSSTRSLGSSASFAASAQALALLK